MSLLSRAIEFSQSLTRVATRAVTTGRAGKDSGVQLYGQWQSGPRLGAREMLIAYGASPWLRAFTQKINHDFATLTWQVFVVTDGGGRAVVDHAVRNAKTFEARNKLLLQRQAEGKLREIPNHPLLTMINGGNDWFSGLVTMELTGTHLDLVGECAWLLELNTLDMPVKAIPFPPTWISRRPTTPDGFYEILAPSGNYQVPAKHVFFAYHPDPANPFRRGVGLAQVLGDEIETDEYAAKYTKDWFKNRAIPPVLITGLGVGLPELQRLEEKWLARYSRRGAGWLPQFLGRDVSVHQLSQTFEQQQLGELRERERDTIRQVYGVPPEQVGIIAPGSSRATIEVSDFIYQSRLIVPRAEFWRAAMQASLVPRYDEKIILGYLSPVKEDREFQLRVRAAQPAAWTVDEWRALGMTDPLPAKRGSIHLLPMGLIPSHLTAEDSLGDPLPAPAGLPEPASSVAHLRPWRAVKGVKPSDIPHLLDLLDVKVLTRAGLPIIKAAVQTFGQAAIDEAEIGIDFNLNDPRVSAHLRLWGAQRMTKVNDTTKAAVRDTLADGLDAGETFDDLVARIQDVFSEASLSRAENIGRTEITRSTGFAANDGLLQVGLDKSWLSTQDSHVRDTHADLDGQTVPADQPFTSSSGATAQHPGDFGDPAEDCNCRCQVIAAIAAERLASSMVQRTALWNVKEVNREPYVRRLRLSMRGAFRKQQATVLAALATADGQTEGAKRWQRSA